MECYFDNSATTKPCQEAVDAAVDALTNRWGNPSSLHKPGDDANRFLTECRKTVAATLRAQPEEIVFTGCGTDSNNLAIFGSALALRRRGKRIVTTDIEHPSVEEPMKRLEEFGFEVVRLPVDSAGTVSKADLTDAVTPKTILSHAEVQGNLGIKQNGKWDIARLPFGHLVGAKAIGDDFRAKTTAHL